MAEKVVFKEKRKPWTKEDIVYHIIAYPIFTIFFFICFYPFYYLLIGTISDNTLVGLNQILFIPRGIHFDNYVDIFKVQNILHSGLISVIRTVCGTGISLICTSYMAYFFTKENMWGRKFWYRMMVVTMYFSAGLIPGYLNSRMLGLVNNFAVYVIPGAISIYNMILTKTYIESLPPSLEEAAVVDGATYFQRFFKIVLPLSKPILATIALFSAVSHWNDFFTTKLYITNTKLYVLQFVLYEYLNQIYVAQAAMTTEDLQSMDAAASKTTTSTRMTMTAITVVPIMCVYPFIQKYYVKGIMIGAVKG